MRRYLAAALAFLIMVSSQAHAEPVRVMAAFVFKSALDDVIRAYKAQGGGDVVMQYGMTPMLAKQVENLAPADVFLSADAEWMNYLQNHNLIQVGTRVDLLTADLVLVARSRDKLETLARELKGEHAVEATVMPADLSTPGAPKALFEAVKKRKLAIDILVNNAGVLEMGAFNAISPERHQELIALNVATLTDMTSRFLAPMLERGKGRILNVASIAAFQPVPSLATYAATKAYVLSLTESLSEELKGSGVTVTALCPGITETSMVDRAREAVSHRSGTPPIRLLNGSSTR